MKFNTRPSILSIQSHYSIEKAAFFMGFGTQSVILVKTNDSNGSMDVNDLVEKLDKHTNDV